MGVRRHAGRECPLCGSEGVLFWKDDDGKKKNFFVYCMNPKCGLGSAVCATEEAALQSWNSRIDYAKKVLSEK